MIFSSSSEIYPKNSLRNLQIHHTDKNFLFFLERTNYFWINFPKNSWILTVFKKFMKKNNWFSSKIEEIIYECSVGGLKLYDNKKESSLVAFHPLKLILHLHAHTQHKKIFNLWCKLNDDKAIKCDSEVKRRRETLQWQ